MYIKQGIKNLCPNPQENKPKYVIGRTMFETDSIPRGNERKIKLK